MRGRGIYVPIIGDPRSLFQALRAGRIAAIDFGVSTEKSGLAAANGMKKAHVAADVLAVDMKKVAIAAEKSAAVQVKAELSRTARLKKEIVIFNEMAAAAKRGSREQVLAANLSARAQRDLSYSMGITSRESMRLQRTSGGANNELNRGFRGALAGSGAFRALGRSLAFASGGFLIFASAASFLRNSVDAARQNLKTQRSLQAQYRASGQDLSQYRKQIVDTINKQSQLGGFTRDELTQAFVVAYRQIGNTTNALRVMADAEGVARGRNLPLWTAVLGLTKAYGGQSTALRRLGILVPTHAKGLQVLTYVERKFAGQLAANTTAAERFHASLYNLEEGAGKVLLPTITSLQNKFAAWAGNTQNQLFLQQQLRQILDGVGGSIKFVYTVTSALVGLFGGWKNAIVLVAGAWLGLKAKAVVAAVAIRATNLKAAFDTAKAWQAARAVQIAATEGTVAANAVADAAIVAETEASALAASAAWRAALLSTGIGALAVIAGSAAAYVFTHWNGVKGLFTGPDGLEVEVTKLTQDFYDLGRAAGKSGELAQAKLGAAQAKVNLDQARTGVQAAKAAELAARGTKQHADAVDNLRLAVQQLATAQGALADATGNVGTAAVGQRKKIAELVNEFRHVAQATYVATHNEPGVGADNTGGGKFTGVPHMNVGAYVKELQAAIDKGVSPQVYQILSGLQTIALTKKNGLPRKLTSFDIPTGRDVKFVVTTVLNDKGKVVDLVKLFSKSHTLAAQLMLPGLEFLNPRPPTSPGAATPPPSIFDKGVQPIKDFQKWMDHQFALLAAIASSTTSQADDLKVAREEQAAIRAAIREHQLHGKELIAAYQELGVLNSTLAGDVKKATDFGTRFANKFALGIAKASASAGGGDDVAIAKAAHAWVQSLISSGKLNRTQLTDAYNELANLNSQLASAAKTSADKAKQARDNLASKVDAALSQIGALFNGPILSPTSAQIKQQLGVLPPTTKTITRDLAAQNADTAAWLKDINKLRKEGASKQLIQELIQAGPDQAAYVHQLATSSKAQIQKYFKEFAQRVKLGREIATVKMTAKNVDLLAQNVTFTHKGKGMQTGGPVGGSGRGDTVPAMLEPGELVVSRAGIGRLAAMLGISRNAAELHALASGRRRRTGPPWHDEGPKYYRDAYHFFKPWATAGPYRTHLSDGQESHFRRWVSRHNVPFDPRARIADYDMRGFWAHGGKWAGGNTHFPDTWKTPYDTTFSRESRYARKGNPFDWRGNKLVNIHTGRVIFSPLGHGGIATRAIAALIGESGPEAVLPLGGSRARPAIATLAGGIAAALGRMPAMSSPRPLGRVTLRANTVLLRADAVYLGGPGGRGNDRGGSMSELILKLDSDVLARATLPRHQRYAKRQVVQVRGRRGGQVLALG